MNTELLREKIKQDVEEITDILDSNYKKEDELSYLLSNKAINDASYDIQVSELLDGVSQSDISLLKTAENKDYGIVGEMLSDAQKGILDISPAEVKDAYMKDISTGKMGKSNETLLGNTLGVSAEDVQNLKTYFSKTTFEKIEEEILDKKLLSKNIATNLHVNKTLLDIVSTGKELKQEKSITKDSSSKLEEVLIQINESKMANFRVENFETAQELLTEEQKNSLFKIYENTKKFDETERKNYFKKIADIVTDSIKYLRDDDQIDKLIKNLNHSNKSDKTLVSNAKDFVTYVSKVMIKAVKKDCLPWNQSFSTSPKPPHNPVTGQIYNPALFNTVQQLQNKEGSRYFTASDIENFSLNIQKETIPILTCNTRETNIERYSLLYCNDDKNISNTKINAIALKNNNLTTCSGLDKFRQNIKNYNQAVINERAFNPIPLNKNDTKEVLSYLKKSPENALKILSKATITKEEVISNQKTKSITHSTQKNYEQEQERD